jgi:hypothetical protein
MKKWFCSIVFCFSVFLSSAQIVFKATVDNNQVALGDNFQITFELDNGDGKRFQPPAFDNFTVLEGPSQSTSVEFNNGSMSKSESYTYVLQPKSVGTFTIDAASISVGGNTLQSNSVKIEVIKGSSSSTNNSNGNSTSSGTTDLTKQIFMVASIDKPSVYEGEQVTLTYKLYTRVNILQMGIDETPPYNGLWAEDINLEKQEPKTEVYNGQQYTTFIVKKTALFASELGKLTINALKMKTTIQVPVKSKRHEDPFQNFFNNPFSGNPFGNEVQNIPYTVPSNAVTIDVKPLPDAGKPSDFNGAVGNFSLESKMDTGSLVTGDPIPMSITISGQGNLKLIDAPVLQLPPDFDNYPPKTNDDINTKSPVISGRKTIDYLFTPRNPGHYEIPPVNFSYFDPDTKQYVLLHTPSYSLTVRKGNGTPTIISSGFSKQDIKLLNQDIRYIKENTTLFITSKPFAGSGLFYALILFPVAAFWGVFFWLDRERKLRGDIIGMKTRQARKMAVKKLVFAKQFLQNQDSKGFYNEVSRAIWGYISDKLTLPASELSRDNLTAYLNEKHVSESTVKELFNVIDHCELALYAPSAAGNNMQHDYEKTADLISKLEQEISSNYETTA